jgi:hypothetical protein
MPMKTEVRDLWADALESDEYKQGRHRLTTVLEDGTEEDCCLGVLCKLAVKAGVIPEPDTWTDPDNGRVMRQYGAEHVSGLLPTEVMEWAGLDSNAPFLADDGEEFGADFWNDTRGATFKDLAAMIREQL